MFVAVFLGFVACVLSILYFFKWYQKKTVKQREAQSAAEEERRSSAKLNFDEIRELMLTNPDVAEEIELKRKEAYIERPTQRLLRDLLESGKEATVLPTYDQSFGFRYETVESAFDENVSPKETEELLERLFQLHVLKKSFFDTVSACPACGSTFITLHYQCPKCASHHIAKTGLTEHIPCGNIDEKDKFNQGHSLPICPKCGSKLIEGEYRDMGFWYICRGCAEKFEHPNLELICRKCGNQFTTRTAIVREISQYFLNPDKEQEIRQNVTSLESINGLLTELGFSVEMSAAAVGEKSGIQHNFSIIAKKTFGDRENIVAIDHAVADTEVGAPPLILYLYKISEVRVDLPIFVAIPKLSESAKRIAQGYNLLVIEGIPREKGQLATLHDEIQKRLSERIVEKRGLRYLSPQEVDIIHQWIIRKGKRADVWRDRKGRFVKRPDD